MVRRKQSNQTTKFIALTLGAILFFYFFGIKILINFAGFLTGLSRSTAPIEVTDIIPPAPPSLNDIPEFTNSGEIEISGKSESGAIIRIFMNEEPNEVLADDKGNFSLSLDLPLIENIIWVIAVDGSGNESVKSEIFEVIIDKKAPVVEITSPKDGETITGNTNRQITINGETEEEAKVTINDRTISVEDNGSFQYTTLLTEGENIFKVIAEDQAGNSSSSTLTINYSP